MVPAPRPLRHRTRARVVALCAVVSSNVAACDRSDASGPAAPHDGASSTTSTSPGGETPTEGPADATTTQVDAASAPASTRTIEVYNGCTEPIDFCIDRADGRETRGSRGPSSYERYELVPGDEVRQRETGGSCGAVLLTVSEQTPAGTRVDLCQS